MKRPLISLASAIALVAPLALAVPATNAAPALPKEGATCTQKELWTRIPVRKVQSKKTGKVSLQRSKGKSADFLTCLPWSFIESEFAPKWLGGTWQFQANWMTASTLEAIGKVDLTRFPENDPCRLTWVSPFNEPWSTSLAWDRSSSDWNLLPTDRPVKGLVIHTWVPANAPEGQAPDIALVNSTMQAALDEARAYWLQQSRGRFTIDLEFSDGLYDSTELGRTPEVWLRNLDDNFDFSDIDFVVFTKTINQGGRVDALDEPLELDGRPIQMFVDLSNTSPSEGSYGFLFKHELGHALGLPDYYARTVTNEHSARFTAANTLMGLSSSYLTGYERWILGWVPDGRVKCVTKTGPGTATLASVDSNGLVDVMTIFPLSRDRAVVVENRTEQLPQNVMPGPNLFIYEVNASSTSSLYAGMGGEAESAYCRRGCPNPERFEEDGFQWHLRLPAMVTYRTDQETLRRLPDSPDPWNYVDDDGTYDREAYVEAYGQWSAENIPDSWMSVVGGNGYIGPESSEAMPEPWLGLRISTPPTVAGADSDSPRLRFTYTFEP